MKKVWMLAGCLLFGLFSCEKEPGEMKQWTIASEMVYRSNGVINELPCLVYKESLNDPWNVALEGISGFDYEPGYEYEVVLETQYLKLDPQIMDASPIRHVLIKVISKTKKESENLPPIHLDYPDTNP